METVDPEALLLPVHSIVVCRTCKISAVADAPTTVLRTVPRPSLGGHCARSHHQFSAAAKCPMELLLGL
ncbi:hypothetical protein VOI45_06845 [Acidaminococcus fermentans]|uniref:hypothetical protein n=1 Tax=Acidaminococcus fermentans TaxID=905 RepID=UPI002E794AA7|nr:hypothetical protein [Acidaminococcus fermentans]MEE1598500.1 hypothetical protein [Acidaminococcus fermentans]MEE4122762.1 hypothetical protein [Acidaminococcus fermentans]